MPIFCRHPKSHNLNTKKDVKEVLKNIHQGKRNAEEFYKRCQIGREDLDKRVTI